MSSSVATNNIHKITTQVRCLFEHARKLVLSRGYDSHTLGQINVLDNAHWWHSVSFGDFMSKVLRNMRLGPMLARDRSSSIVYIVEN
jgi:tyrosyl-tRNA synthetase